MAVNVLVLESSEHHKATCTFGVQLRDVETPFTTIELDDNRQQDNSANITNVLTGVNSTTNLAKTNDPTVSRVHTVQFDNNTLKHTLSNQSSLASLTGNNGGNTITRRGKLQSFKSSTDNLLDSERDELRGVKAILGLVGGLLLGACIFAIYRYVFGYMLEEVGISVSVITLLVCLCLALSSFLRHVVLLVIPNFFTGTGRAVMLSAIFALIVQYPVTNIAHNARETGSSMSCIMDIAVNQSLIVEREIADSLRQITEYVDKQNTLLKAPAKQIHNTIKDVKELIRTMDKVALNTNTATTYLRKKCMSVSNTVKSQCSKTCESIPVISRTCDEVCGELDIDTDCNVISYVSHTTRANRDVLLEAVDYFDVDVEMTGYLHAGVNTSTQPDAIQQQVEEIIGGKIDVFLIISSSVLKCLAWPLLIYIFVQSFWYLRNYLAKDGYDNVYITKQFQQLDRSLGENCILPLKKREQDIYVNTRSFRLNQIELSFCWVGLVQVGFHFLLCVFVTLFDYALYHILLLVNHHGDVKFNVTSNKMSVSVQGSGPAAEFYRIITQGYTSGEPLEASFDIEHCLPNPHEPTHSMIPVFIVLYVTTVAIVLLRAYGMRLRRKCAANYCPEQEMARLDYLHKRIRHKRIGFLQFLRQQIQSAHKENEVKRRLRLSTWLITNFKLFEMILPTKQKTKCTSCEQHETSFNNMKITKCPGTKYGSQRCEAAYCRECLEALQNICPLCSDKDDVNLR